LAIGAVVAAALAAVAAFVVPALGRESWAEAVVGSGAIVVVLAVCFLSPRLLARRRRARPHSTPS